MLFILIPHKLKINHIIKVFIFLNNNNIRAIVGFPFFKRKLLRPYFQQNPVFRIKSIDDKSFFGSSIKKFKQTNAPFLFALNKINPDLEIP